MDHVAVIAEFNPKQGFEERVETILRTMVGPSRDEGGCLQYDLYRNDNSFTIVERYRDMAAIEAHRATDHFAAYRAAIANVLDGPIQVTVTYPVDALP